MLFKNNLLYNYYMEKLRKKIFNFGGSCGIIIRIGEMEQLGLTAGNWVDITIERTDKNKLLAEISGQMMKENNVKELRLKLRENEKHNHKGELPFVLPAQNKQVIKCQQVI